MILQDRRGGGGEEAARRAGEIAVRALAFLAADADRIGRFLAVTGLDPADLRGIAARADFQAGLLDHLLADESLLLAFCAECDIDPAEMQPARRALAPDGGEQA